MVKGFTDRWKQNEKDPSIVSKIANVGKSQESIKDQITQVTKRLDMQTQGLDAAIVRFQNRDKEMFNRVVKAMANHEEARANIFATELAEIRKVTKMLSHASLALQSVSMRLSTVSEMGDLVAALSPAKTLLNDVRAEMCGILPEASQELGSIGDLLGEICTTTNQDSGMSLNPGGPSPDALGILEEAEAAAALKLNERLPEVSNEQPLKRRTGLESSSL
ncbi:MAG: hypothetical protein NWE92_08240 [Candidatus Bathyarchaeota archaeon]|nr:hypothetical protein [Candidatus Bathyarchaeota archaeon]